MSTSDPAAVTVWWRSLSLRDVARGVLVVLLVMVGLALLIALRGVLTTVFFGILLATALSPVVNRLSGKNVPRFVVASAILLLLVALMIGVVIAVIPMLVSNVETLLQELPRAYDQLRAWLAASPSRLVRQLSALLRPASLTPDAGATNELPQLALSYLPSIGAFLFYTASVLALMYYWLLYRDRSVQEILLLLPLERRRPTLDLWTRIEDSIGSFVRGQGILGLQTGLLSLAGYWAVGAPYPILLGVLAGVLEIVPFIGPILTAAIATVIGLSVSVEKGLLTLLVGLIVQQLENNLLAPRVMSHTVGVSPVLGLLTFIGAAALLGPLGGILATPIAAVVGIAFNEWLKLRAGAELEGGIEGRTVFDRLRFQARKLKLALMRQMREKEDVVNEAVDQDEEDLVRALTDLDTLLQIAAADKSPSSAALMETAK